MALYVNNRALLAEIHARKSSYCFFTHPDYAEYHAIVAKPAGITAEIIAEALARRRRTDPEATAKGLIIRVMSDRNLPIEPDEAVRRRGRRASGKRRGGGTLRCGVAL